MQDAPSRDTAGRLILVFTSAKLVDFEWLSDWCDERSLVCELCPVRDDYDQRAISGAALVVAETKDVLRTLDRESASPRVQRTKTLAIASSSHEAGAALSSGATDAIRRPFTREELGARIERLVVDEEPLLECRSLKLDRRRCQVVVDGTLLRLRKAEYTVLKYLMRARPRVVPTHELLQVALGTCGDGGTVRYHICELRRKLRAAGADHLQTQRGQGYWIADEPA